MTKLKRKKLEQNLPARPDMPILLEAKHLLSRWHTYLKDPSVLSVCDAPEMLPWAFVITEKDDPSHLLLSFSVDYPYAINAAELALQVNKLRPIKMMESFYINKVGSMHWGEDAISYFELDKDMDLNHINPIDNNKH